MSKMTKILTVLWFVGLIAPCFYYIIACPSGDSFYSLAIWQIAISFHCPIISALGAVLAYLFAEGAGKRIFIILAISGTIFSAFLITFISIIKEISDAPFANSAFFAGTVAIEAAFLQCAVLLLVWIIKRIRK